LRSRYGHAHYDSLSLQLKVRNVIGAVNYRRRKRITKIKFLKSFIGKWRLDSVQAKRRNG
jgi:hypothetical protein